MAKKLVESTEFGSPFLHMSVEDVVMVKSTKFWQNNNVRVLGRVRNCEMTNEKLVFESPLQFSNSVKLTLNVDVLNYELPQGKLMEIFGYLNVLPNDDPILTVLFHRNVTGVSITSYYKAKCLRSKYVPQFNDKDDEICLSPAQYTDEKDEISSSPQVSNFIPSQE